jgi:hypothetical protein
VRINLMLLEGATVMVATGKGCLIDRRDQRTAECTALCGPDCTATASTSGQRLRQILYIGEHGLAAAALDTAIDDIRAATAERAQIFGLTGALVLTKMGFAQLLEGPYAEVETCLAALKCDPRHANALLIEEGDVGARQFNGWSVSYADPASFVGRTTFRAIAGAALGTRSDIDRLVWLMLKAGGCSDDDLGIALQAVADQARSSA